MRILTKILHPSDIDKLNNILYDSANYSALFNYFDSSQIKHEKFRDTLYLLDDLGILTYNPITNKVNKLFEFSNSNVVNKLLNDYGDKLFEVIYIENVIRYRLIKPLTFSAYRDYLLQSNVLFQKNNSYYLQKNKTYLVEDNIIQKKKAVSLNELKIQLEKQNQIGELSESIAFEYEKKRVFPKVPVVISHIDVNRGFDMLSYQNTDSKEFDKFIEVKTANDKKQFYISKNELNTLKHYKEKYSLYYVNTQQKSVDTFDNIYKLIENKLVTLEPTNFIASIGDYLD